MPSKLFSAAREGINARSIEVEVDVSSGLHSFSIVGLGDKAVSEAKERISSALKNSGFKPPRSFSKRVIINLAPADLKKEGGMYDVPMALGFLIDSSQTQNNEKVLENTLFTGELGLDGQIRPIKGSLLYALYAKENWYGAIVVPKQNKEEAVLAGGINVIPAENIKEITEYIEGRKPNIGELPKKYPKTQPQKKSGPEENDLAYIKGQEHAKKAMEVAAAGGHNLLLQGPPGSGKTLLAQSMPTILPHMSEKEALEVSKIASICGIFPETGHLITKRPFRAPHHTASEAAVIGGGNTLEAGEITKAHKGVLFMDEFPEFYRNVLESLRQPIEEGIINISRAKGSVSYPAEFTLVAAANPCPCGHFGDKSKECSCTTNKIMHYQKKLSGPIADRIDLHVNVPRQPYKKLKISTETDEEPSYKVRERVNIARNQQAERFKGESINLNSEMKVRHIKKHCKIDKKLEDLLGKAVEKYKLTGRGYHSVLKTARTVADISQEKDIKWPHISLALQYTKREEEVL